MRELSQSNQAPPLGTSRLMACCSASSGSEPFVMDFFRPYLSSISSFMSALRALRHPIRAGVLRVAFAAFILLILLDFTDFFTPTRLTPADNSSYTPHGQKIFISSTHWNNEHVLRSHWNQAIIDLVHQLGPEHVHISILESGSWDNTKDALRDLDKRLNHLNVTRTIILDETTHLDEIQKIPLDGAGWVDTPRGRREPRRIPFLSRLRNKTLEPLTKLAEAGRSFDKIVFLNDVVFSVSAGPSPLHRAFTLSASSDVTL